jgi:SAM-dependent methyltransferase
MNCKICHSDAVSRVGSIQGYRKGTYFAVFECQVCESSTVDPCESDDKLYEAIYENVARVPGYSRYHLLAQELHHVRDPLTYIANTEECYWAIIKTLSEKVSDKSQSRICEVGCGQGYLTYSLVRAGFNSTGVDISAKAIALARTHYGNHYFCGRINDFIRTNDRPDIIVATELIEHLEQPVEFVLNMLDALNHDGILALTTPNKLVHAGVIWDTELPPVHLWWFSKGGLVAIAKELSCKIDFVDFTEFYRKNPQYRLRNQSTVKERMPVFDHQYQLIQSTPAGGKLRSLKRTLREILPPSLVRKVKRLRAGGDHASEVSDSTSGTIGAVFTKSA